MPGDLTRGLVGSHKFEACQELLECDEGVSASSHYFPTLDHNRGVLPQTQLGENVTEAGLPRLSGYKGTSED